MGQDWQTEITQYLPLELRTPLHSLEASVAKYTEEIRIRANGSLMIKADGRDMFIGENGEVTNQLNAMQISVELVHELFERITRASIYAIEHELMNGYTTLPGGYRVGFCGKTVLKDSMPSIVAPCASFNIRIVREVIGCSKDVLPYIVHDGIVHSTLIVSRPGLGKTTLLRDITRSLSMGINGAHAKQVSVVDERSEIAACYGGVPQTSLGPRVDVLDSCPKAEGMSMLLRSMAPNVLVVDELATSKEFEAVQDAVCAGVSVIASMHGDSVRDVINRPLFSMHKNNPVFSRCVVLGRGKKVGEIKYVYELPQGKVIYQGDFERKSI